jgi:hypothetical protein
MSNVRIVLLKLMKIHDHIMSLGCGLPIVKVGIEEYYDFN